MPAKTMALASNPSRDGSDSFTVSCRRSSSAGGVGADGDSGEKEANQTIGGRFAPGGSPFGEGKCGGKHDDGQYAVQQMHRASGPQAFDPHRRADDTLSDEDQFVDDQRAPEAGGQAAFGEGEIQRPGADGEGVDE